MRGIWRLSYLMLGIWECIWEYVVVMIRSCKKFRDFAYSA